MRDGLKYGWTGPVYSEGCFPYMIYGQRTIWLTNSPFNIRKYTIGVFFTLSKNIVSSEVKLLLMPQPWMYCTYLYCDSLLNREAEKKSQSVWINRHVESFPDGSICVRNRVFQIFCHLFNLLFLALSNLHSCVRTRKQNEGSDVIKRKLTSCIALYFRRIAVLYNNTLGASLELCALLDITIHSPYVVNVRVRTTWVCTYEHFW